MTDTPDGTSEVKLCASCGEAFGDKDDKRYSKCADCRAGIVPEEEKPVAPAEAKSDGVEALTLDVETQQPPPVEDREFYWCGSTMDCPMDITLGGLEFQRTEGEVIERPDGQGEFRDHARKGKILRLTETNVKLALEHCANKVVRHFSRNVKADAKGKEYVTYTGQLLGIHGKRHQFVSHPSDKPLGQFVYMIKVRHKEDRPYSDPPTLIPRDW